MKTVGDFIVAFMFGVMLLMGIALIVIPNARREPEQALFGYIFLSIGALYCVERIWEHVSTVWKERKKK